MIHNDILQKSCCSYDLNKGCPKSEWTFEGEIGHDVRNPLIYSVFIFLKAPCGKRIEVQNEDYQTCYEEVETYVRSLVKVYKELWDKEAKMCRSPFHTCIFR